MAGYGWPIMFQMSGFFLLLHATTLCSVLLLALFSTSLSPIFSSGWTSATVQASPLTARPPEILPEFKDLSDVKVSWITVGLGPQIHSRYGHSFLKFELTTTSRSWLYNWGMFSFENPLFPLKFFLGDRQYWVESMDLRQIMIIYQRHEDRNVWEQEITLTDKQKKLLIHGVNDALKPENRFFQYEHFTANCATIPRDILNATLGGYIYRQLSTQPAGVDYRFYVTEHMAKFPPLSFLLDLTMNSLLDTPLSKWQESFYPVKLSEHLSALPALDDLGHPREAVTLFGAKKHLITASSNHETRTGSFPLWFALSWASALALLWMGFIKWSHRRGYRILFGLYSILWGLLSSGVGLIMIISWIFSTHLDMHHNLNLWLLSVTDLIFIGWGVTSLRRSQRIPSIRMYFPHKPWHLVYISLRGVCLMTFAVISVSSLSQQNVSTAMTYIWPLQVGYIGLCAALWWRENSQKTKKSSCQIIQPHLTGKEYINK